MALLPYPEQDKPSWGHSTDPALAEGLGRSGLCPAPCPKPHWCPCAPLFGPAPRQGGLGAGTCPYHQTHPCPRDVSMNIPD